MCNTLVKIASAVVLIIAIILNFFGNLFGIGDIIPTEPKTTESTSVSQSVTYPAETTTKEFTTEESTTEPVTEPSTEITTVPTTEPTTKETTLQPSTDPITTRPTTTKEFGPKVESATQENFASFGGSNTDTFTGIDTTSGGGYVVCGVTASTDGMLENVPADSWSESYAFVSKYDKNMNLEWIKSVGSDYASVRIEDVAVLSDGSVVAVGYTTADDFASASKYKGTIESFVIKYSSNGNVQWKKLFGGSGNDMLMCVEPLGSGFVAGGKTDSKNGSFADNTENSNSNALLMSFDANGNKLWCKYLSGNYGASVDGIATDSDGNIFITCVTAASTGDFKIDGMGKGYLDTAVIKFNSSGERKWAFAVASSGRDNFRAIVADENGGCVVAGNYELVTTYAPDGTFENLHNCGGIDAVAIRINSNGTKRWERSVAGFSDDFINDIAMTGNGGFAVVGYTSSGNRDFASVGNKGQSDAFTAFLTPAGNLADVKANGGARKDMATCAAYTTAGKLIVLGQSTSSDGDFDGMNSHLSDTFINLFGDAFTGYMTKYGVSIY